MASVVSSNHKAMTLCHIDIALRTEMGVFRTDAQLNIIAGTRILRNT